MKRRESFDENLVSELLSIVNPSDVELPFLVPDHERISDSTSVSKKRKRKIRHVCDSILNEFRLPGNGKIPTKENIRIMMIRSHKRANRYIEMSKHPTCKKLRFARTDRISLALWNKLKEICIEENLGPLSVTETGPLTDGKNKRPIEERAPKSFNDYYCASYFRRKAVRKSYHFFIEFLFANFDPLLLSQKFLLKCCEDNQHLDCMQKWVDMKRFVQKDFLRSIEIKPWNPDSI